MLAGKHLIGDDFNAFIEDKQGLQTIDLEENRKRNNIVQTGWSRPFSIDSVGEDFKISFFPQDINLDNARYLTAD